VEGNKLSHTSSSQVVLKPLPSLANNVALIREIIFSVLDVTRQRICHSNDSIYSHISQQHLTNAA
jgi:hypothetical protein